MLITPANITPKSLSRYTEPMMLTDSQVPRSAAASGLRVYPTGTHLSSTMKLEELRALLAQRPGPVTLGNYRTAVVEQNVLGKPTATTRRITFERLRELYGLEPDLLVFRALTDLWDADVSAQPTIALLCSTARDPILRAVTPFVLQLSIGETITTQGLAEEAERQFPEKFVPSSRNRLGRNVLSSWGKAGLLSGRQQKVRTKPYASPTALAYALLLGDLCGERGQALFTTLWADILGAPPHELKELASAASRQGWIEYRSAGDVVEVSFRHLMRD